MSRRRPAVLAARLDNAGDVLLMGPALRAIAARAAHVTLLCGPDGAAAGALRPGVDDVMTFAAPWSGYAPPAVDRRALHHLEHAVNERGFDEAIIFTSAHQSPLPLALVLRLAGVARISAISEDYPGSLLDVRARDDGDVHEVERAFGLAVAAGFASPGDDPGPLAVRLPSPVTPFRQPYVVVHPGASVAARGLGAARAADVVRAVTATGRRVVVTGSAAERAAVAAAARGADRAPGAPVHTLAPARGLEQLAAVIAGADAIVVGNTGPAHLAAALGTPVVSVFAPVVPLARWRPWRVPHVVLGRQDVECRDCRARVCSRPGMPCLGSVDGDAVAAALDELAPLSTGTGRIAEVRA